MSATSKLPDRLRFSAFMLDRLPNGRCRARVTLSWPEGAEFSGEAEGLASQSGELRCAADACVLALTRATSNELRFEVLGVKSIRAFDANVVIVSLSHPGGERPQRLIGCFMTEEADPTKGAALAVLNATNRILGNRFFMR